MHGDMAFDEADLHGFVDGRIEPSRAAALAASLGSDPDAAARIDAWRRQTESLRSMFTSVLCEPVPVRLLPIAVPAQGVPAGRTPPRATPGRRLAGAVATTAIGAALVGFALGALTGAGTDGFGLAPLAAHDAGTAGAEARDVAARAAEAHRTFLAEATWPTEAGSAANGEATKPARSSGHRLAAGLPVPDLARQGWTLTGGRIVPGRRGPATFLIYGDGADRLGLLVSRGDAGDAGSVARLVAVDDEAGPLGVAAWTDGEVAYAITSGRGRDWLARHLGPLRDAVRARMRAGAEELSAR